MGSESLEYTKPLVPSFLFFFIARDSEAPGVGGVESLEAWDEAVWSSQKAVWQKARNLEPLADPWLCR